MQQLYHLSERVKWLDLVTRLTAEQRESGVPECKAAWLPYWDSLLLFTGNTSSAEFSVLEKKQPCTSYNLYNKKYLVNSNKRGIIITKLLGLGCWNAMLKTEVRCSCAYGIKSMHGGFNVFWVCRIAFCSVGCVVLGSHTWNYMFTLLCTL